MPFAKLEKQMTALRTEVGAMVADGRSDAALEMMFTRIELLHQRNLALELEALIERRRKAGLKSERLDPAQISLMMEAEPVPTGDDARDETDDRTELQTEDAILTEEITAAEATQATPPRRRPVRRALPTALPREVIEHTLEPEARACGDCGKPMAEIGKDTSEVLRLVPARFEVEEHRRAKYACSRCRKTVVTAPGPAKFIEKGRAAPSLLAHVVQSKYQDHLPLARLCEIYDRGGVPLPSSTLGDWTARVAEEVRPVADRILEKALEAHVTQSDATGLAVLTRSEPTNIRRGTIWCVTGDETYVAFQYAPTGSGEDGPWKFLAGRAGYLQTDAASGFDRLHDGQVASATEVGCWAHARRRFHDLRDSDPRVAYPLKNISQLYRVEKLATLRGLDPPERQKLREERSRRILGRLMRWIERTLKTEPPASALAKACTYVVNQHDALFRFLDDGHLRLDNNFCERELRSIALGRKNYLFAGSHAAAERTAILYTVVRTAVAARRDVFAYLTKTLTRIAEGWPVSRIDELLPENHVPDSPDNDG